MAANDEKWELARVISATQHRLHHDHMRRVLAESNLDCPAITPQQIHMLLAVRERGCMTIKQLTQTLLVKAPAASVMVDKLVEMGIFTREENPADRREVLVRVSRKEESLIQEIERGYLQLTVDLLDKIGLEYARMWGNLCKRIEEVMESDRPV
jgi:DNA-binding MarR family transcriptional regulator